MVLQGEPCGRVGRRRTPTQTGPPTRVALSALGTGLRRSWSRLGLSRQQSGRARWRTVRVAIDGENPSGTRDVVPRAAQAPIEVAGPHAAHRGRRTLVGAVVAPRAADSPDQLWGGDVRQQVTSPVGQVARTAPGVAARRPLTGRADTAIAAPSPRETSPATRAGRPASGQQVATATDRGVPSPPVVKDAPRGRGSKVAIATGPARPSRPGTGAPTAARGPVDRLRPVAAVTVTGVVRERRGAAVRNVRPSRRRARPTTPHLPYPRTSPDSSWTPPFGVSSAPSPGARRRALPATW